MKKICAEKLRKRGGLKDFHKPGIYKWWAPIEQLRELLQILLPSSVDDQKAVENKVEKKGDLYCIYVGQAKYLDDRLSKHLSGSLNNSTFRKSLGAILSANKKWDAEKIRVEVNNFINKLSVECIDVENVDDLNIKEGKQISRKLRILNIEGYNRTDFYKYIDKPLSDFRDKLKKKDEIGAI